GKPGLNAMAGCAQGRRDADCLVPPAGTRQYDDATSPDSYPGGPLMRSTPTTLALAVLTVWAGLNSAAAAGEPPPYAVGVAQADTPPAYRVRLSGFGFRRTESEGVTQRIWAKALAIQAEGDEPAVLLTVDNVGVPAYLVREVAGRLAKKAGLKPERL